MNSEKEITNGLTRRIIRFSTFLKERGFRVFQSSIIDANRSILEIDLSRKEDFLSALQVNLTSNSLEWCQFRELFREFWDKEAKATEREKARGHEEERENQMDHSAKRASSRDRMSQENPVEDELIGELDLNLSKTENDCQEPLSKVVGCSSDSNFQLKDFSKLDPCDLRMAHLEIKKMIQSFKLNRSRRFKGAKNHGVIDLHKTIRKGLINDGVPSELIYKRKKKKVKKLIVLADVSGSMDRYAQFVVPFVLGFRGIGSRIQVFVFSTSLSCITPYIRSLNLEDAIRRMSQGVRGWSGGTRIGHSLKQFNEKHSSKLLDGRTVIIVLSDGMEYWGEEKLLEKEMAEMSKRAHSIIWLNPKAGDSFYRPVYKGMAAAMPHIDHLLPADSLQSLNRVGRLLSRIMVS